jgi:uncharacterized protein YkwD
MKMAVKTISIFLMLMFVLTSCSKEETSTEISLLTENVISLEIELASLVNEHRSALGMSEFQLNTVAYNVANEHNDYMIAQGKLSHDNFENRASKIYSGTEAKEVGENVGKNFQSAQEALNWWLNSESHRINLESDFTHTAISIKKDSSGNLYYTHIFFR